LKQNYYLMQLFTLHFSVSDASDFHFISRTLFLHGKAVKEIQ